jgi:AI-2 transport protein TqsA
MKSSDLKSIKILLLIIALPISFYVLNLLSFIFIPLLFSMIVALMFSPLMRKLNKKKIPKTINLFIVILIIVVFIFLINQVIQFSGQELMSSDNNILFDRC